MVRLTMLAALLVCITSVVQARYYDDGTKRKEDTADTIQTDEQTVKIHKNRHRSRRTPNNGWWSQYGQEGYNGIPFYPVPPVYGVPNPPPPLPPPGIPLPLDRLYSQINQITELIKKIQSTTLSIPNQQPVYVFYPVFISSKNNVSKTDCPKDDETPDIKDRFPDMDDPRQNWGLVVPKDKATTVAPTLDVDDYDDEPFKELSFDPVAPAIPTTRPQPSIEHGSSPTRPQAAINNNKPSNTPSITSSGTSTQKKVRTPSQCDLAVLTCCFRRTPTYECFAEMQCPRNFVIGNPCDQKVILRVLDVFRSVYEP